MQVTKISELAQALGMAEGVKGSIGEEGENSIWCDGTRF